MDDSLIKKVSKRHKITAKENVRRLVMLVRLDAEGDADAVESLLNSIEEASPVLDAFQEYRERSVVTDKMRWEVIKERIKGFFKETVVRIFMGEPVEFKSRGATLLQTIIPAALTYTSYYDLLLRRVNLREVGLSGHVTEMELELADEEGLKPLNWFEKFFMAGGIALQKEVRRKNFSRVMQQELGEPI